MMTEGKKDFDEAVHLIFTEHQSTTRDALLRSSQRRTSTIADMKAYMLRSKLFVDNNKDDRRIPLLHVAGTKGKGSTACFSESILRNVYGYNTGLFTSPHLVDIRERIRLNGKPVSKKEFADAYFTLRERLMESREIPEGFNDEKFEFLPVLPGYFKMLTLIAVYIFSNHIFPPNENDSVTGRVDVIIIECGMGGRYDATNIFDKTIYYPLASSDDDDDDDARKYIFACGITLIDYDHVRVLGQKLEEIAWEKGGIFQHDEKSTTTKQHDEEPQIIQRFFTIESNTESVLQVFRKSLQETNNLKNTFDQQHKLKQDLNFYYLSNENQQSNDGVKATCRDKIQENLFFANKKSDLQIVAKDTEISLDWEVGIPGEHQRLNAELAVALCKSIHKQMLIISSPSSFSEGTIEKQKSQLLQYALKNTLWPGRCQSVFLGERRDGITHYLHCDGAHTIESMTSCIEWLKRVAGNNKKKKESRNISNILIFNCSHERNPVPLLNCIAEAIHNKSNSSDLQLTNFSSVFFCYADSERPSMIHKMSANELLREAGFEQFGKQNDENETEGSWQESLAKIWNTLQRIHSNIIGEEEFSGSEKNVFFNISVKEAIDKIFSDSQSIPVSSSSSIAEVNICVTGSLYLAGSVLNAVGWEEPSADTSFGADLCQKKDFKL